MAAGSKAGQPGYAGWVSEVASFTELVAHVFIQPTSIVRYGALVEVNDASTGRSYLAVVTDVSESLSIASVDPQALRNMIKNLVSSQAQYQPIDRLLGQLFGSGLVHSFGIREVKLRLLGEIDQSGGTPRLLLPQEPPRPMSTVREPDPRLLQALVAHGLGDKGLEIGELVYNPGVKALLDPDGLTTHMAILGQTGAGKSETVKRLVAEYAWRKGLFSTEGGVIVFDVAGEYTGYPYKPRRRAGQSSPPLLDAVMRPHLFPHAQALIQKHGRLWAANAEKTIIVPYDLFTLPLRSGAAGERSYAQAIGELVEDLKKRYPQADAVGLLYARHHVYRVDGANNVTPISRTDAARIIGAAELLVAATPLPDMLAVDEIAALSQTRSLYIDTAVVEAADSLGLLDVENVSPVSSLILLLEATSKVARQFQGLRGQQQVNAVVTKIKSTFTSMLNGIKNGTDPRQAVDGFLKTIGIPSFEYNVRAMLNLLALPELVSDPAADPYSLATVQKALGNSNYIPGIAWERFLATGVSSAAQAFMRYEANTRGSILRGLRRVERLISPWLDPGQYRLLMERALGGFTVVHLAAPSRGDTDMVNAMMLSELFAISHRRYSSGRRTLIVVEEAHNLAPAGEDKAAKNALLRIAREGRKWGLSLVLVSQRPGFIDEGILSQAATLVAMRVTNPNDLSVMRRSVESASQEMIDRLPDLEPGQAVVSGPAVPERRIPLLVRIEMLPQPASPSQPGTAPGAGGQAAGGTP